ncbi:MAG: metabolite traffic protein EboE [Planctomycetota bacterium]
MLIQPRQHELELTYCTNVHPGETVEEIHRYLREITIPLKGRVCPDRRMGVGMWLSNRAARELDEVPGALQALRQTLEDARLYVFTVNAFPYGDFHQTRVKEKVYKPSWVDEERALFSIRVARVLAALSPSAEPSFSSLCGTFRDWEEPLDRNRMAAHIAAVAHALSLIREQTGKTVRIALEPEPMTSVETTEEAVAFFEGTVFRKARAFLATRAGFSESQAEEILRRHVGICFDTCHLAVQYEDLAASLARLRAAGIAVPKVQLSSALRLQDPADNEDGRRELARFDEERYLHQAVGRRKDGTKLRATDLPELFENSDWLEAESWRVHFHVPIFVTTLPSLQTTQGDLMEALESLVETGQCRHLEIETYTWGVIPEEERSQECGDDLVTSLEREYRWVLENAR